MAKKNTTQLNNEPVAPDRGRIFFDVIGPLVQKHTELEFAKPNRAREWRQYRKEFRTFVRSLGIKLSSFDKVIRNEELISFLIGYYLCAKGDAPGYVINHTFNLLLQNCIFMYMSEIEELLKKLDQVSEDVRHEFTSRFSFNCASNLDKDYNLIPKVSAVRCGFLSYLISRNYCLQIEVEAILGTPYSPYFNCEPAELVVFLFDMHWWKEVLPPELLFPDPEVLPVVKQILDALMAEIKGRYE